MKSIRRQLLLSMLAAVLIAGCAAALGLYFKAQQEIGALFDYQLRQMALSLRDQALRNAGEIQSPPVEDGLDYVIQISSEDGLVIYYMHARSPLPTVAGSGHATVDLPDGAWRVYTLRQRGATVQVAQPLQLRNRLAAQGALRTLAPFMLTLPLLAALLWFAVGRGLKPLKAVATAVKARSATSLPPLPEDTAPEEVRPLISALNDLLARLARTLENQREFVADAAHELRTPLTALALQVQLAERATQPNERAASFETLRQGLDRATRLVEQLLTLAREEPGANDRPMANVELGEVAAEAVGAYATLADSRGIDLGLARCDAHSTVHADRDALRILISNLIGNAVRYTARDGRVDVSVLQTEKGVVLEVTDNGPGIPPQERERVFDRFYRRAASEAQGSGLGLAIVRSIAQRHGAKVNLDSGPGERGLTARVTFPGVAGLQSSAAMKRG